MLPIGRTVCNPTWPAFSPIAHVPAFALNLLLLLGLHPRLLYAVIDAVIVEDAGILCECRLVNLLHLRARHRHS